MIREAIKRAKQWREASKVERVHGTPHVGSYSVRQHSFDACCLLLLLHPTLLDTLLGTPEGRLLVATMTHDFQERYLGDLYGPAKTRYPELAAYGRAEVDVAYRMGLPIEAFTGLDDDSRDWLGAVDDLELQLFSEDQAAFGNRHTEQIRERVAAHLLANSNAPRAVLDFLKFFNWTRTEEE
jgi:5'-deoxynucleotidase YfbR-like HD superfamily hydrolase